MTSWAFPEKRIESNDFAAWKIDTNFESVSGAASSSNSYFTDGGVRRSIDTRPILTQNSVHHLNCYHCSLLTVSSRSRGCRDH